MRWCKEFPGIVKRLQQGLLELLTFFNEPEFPWPKVMTTNIIEGCLVEVPHRTRPWFAL